MWPYLGAEFLEALLDLFSGRRAVETKIPTTDHAEKTAPTANACSGIDAAIAEETAFRKVVSISVSRHADRLGLVKRAVPEQ